MRRGAVGDERRHRRWVRWIGHLRKIQTHFECNFKFASFALAHVCREERVMLDAGLECRSGSERGGGEGVPRVDLRREVLDGQHQLARDVDVESLLREVHLHVASVARRLDHSAVHLAPVRVPAKVNRK